MIEVEYMREGIGKVFIAPNNDEEYPTPTKKTITLRCFPRRKRRAPCAVNRLKKILNESCYSKEFSDDYNDYGFGKNKRLMILLPPATIIREREITIEYGEWRKPNESV
jgi:hypothetical protein